MQERISRILIIFLLFTASLPAIITAQVVVERSKDKVIISGKPYYIHIVKKGETRYSISRAYGISDDELVKENPSASRGIKEGQSLRLPVVESVAKPVTPSPPKIVVQRDEAKFIYHKLSKGDTVYSLARKYGVSEDEILQSNPGVEINRLPVDTEIAIPRRQFSSSSQTLQAPESDYLTYKVGKGESIASIAEKFGVTVREIRKENKGIIFPKTDEYIRIPVSRVAENELKQDLLRDTVRVEEEKPEEKPERPAGYTPVGDLRGKYNIAVLLPLYYPENAIRSEIDSSQTVKGKRIKRVLRREDSWIYDGTLPFLELYQGILIAADTLRSKGLDVNVHLYDIKEDTIETVRLIESGSLESMDLIIGPVYSRNLSIVADYGARKEIPVVSPVPLWNNSVVTGKPYLFMAIPSLEVSQEAISRKVSEYASSNFVFIHSDTIRNDESVTAYKNMIFRELTGKIPFEEIRFKEFLFKNRSSLTNDSINRLEHAMSNKGDNTVIIASEDPSVLSESIMDLHSLTRNYKIRFIGYPRVRELVNLDPKFFFELGVELYTPYWIDYKQNDIMAFNKTFREKFHTEPSEESFAWEGYDITYYFLSGLAIHGKRFLRRPEIHNPDLLENDFEFIRLGEDNGFENHKLYHIVYTSDMEIKVLDENNPAENRINNNN
jgi:LysM repeat protein